MDPMLVATGLAVGLLVGLTGVGGGAVMTPALILYGIPPAVAVGTDLVYAALTKTAGVVIHQARGNVRWGVVLRLAAGSLPAACAMLWWLDQRKASGHGDDRLITTVLGIALVLTALVVLLRPWLSRHVRLPSPASNGMVTVAGGVVLGALVAASSVGAGALCAALLLTTHRRLPVTAVVGTDLAHAVLLATVAAIGHWQMGSVDLALVAPLLAGSLPGVYVGARLTGVVPDRLMAPLMAIVLFTLGIGFSLGAVN